MTKLGLEPHFLTSGVEALFIGCAVLTFVLKGPEAIKMVQERAMHDVMQLNILTPGKFCSVPVYPTEDM